MATSMELSPHNVGTALEDLSVEKTEKLVFHLGVPQKDLDDIALQYSGSSRKRHSIQAWLDSDTHASWEKLVSGLKQIGMTVVAKRVESTFVPQVEVPVTVCTSVPVSSASVPPVQAVSSPAPLETGHVTPVTAAPIPASIQPSTPAINPSQPPAVSTERVAEVKATIEQLKEEFADIKADTRSSLSKKERQDPEFLNRFRDHLLELPVAEKPVHVEFFDEKEDKILEAKNIQKLFTIISRYCNYSNYEIILHLIKKFCEAALTSRMYQYRDSLIEFEMATTIDVYLCAISACEKLCEAFSKMAAKIDKPPSVCTLHEVRQLKEDIAKEAHLHSHGVYLESVSESSVLVVLRIPLSCVGLVRTAITPDFARVHHLTEVTVDGVNLVINEREKEESGRQVWVAGAVEVVSLADSVAELDTPDELSVSSTLPPSRLHDPGNQSPSLPHSRHLFYSSLKQPSVLFHKMLRNIADQLTTEEVKSLVYIHSIEKSGRDPNERPTALDVFRSLEERAVFSPASLKPLEEILGGIQRHDLVTTVVRDFKVKISICRVESAPVLRAHDPPDCEPFVPPSYKPTPPMSKHQKMELLHCLMSDPELQTHIKSLRLGSPTDSLRSALSTSSAPQPSRGLMSTQFFISSPEASLTSYRKDDKKSTRPCLKTESSIDAVTTAAKATAGPHPPISHPAPHKMRWSINRVDLGQRIVMHSNSALIKGDFSLTASGIKFWFRKPVSLVFKVYPFGLGKDKNQSLTLEVVVECRSEELKSIGFLNLTIHLSMECEPQFTSSRTWKKPLKTFQIHDFLSHEVITHRSSKSLDFDIEAFITFD